MFRLLLVSVFLVGLAACPGPQTPSLRVLGVEQSKAQEVVFVQVTNPANRPMRLTRLEYTFASQGTTLSTGSVPLARELAASSATVIEVPLHVQPQGEITLQGKLTATIDQIVKSFAVSAKIQPD